MFPAWISTDFRVDSYPQFWNTVWLSLSLLNDVPLLSRQQSAISLKKPTFHEKWGIRLINARLAVHGVSLSRSKDETL